MKTIITLILLAFTNICIGQIRYDTVQSGQTAIIKIGAEMEILRYNDSANPRYYQSVDGVHGFDYYHLIPTSYSIDTVLTIWATMTAENGAILFERGGMWRGLTLIPHANSTYVGSYGSGAKPIFNGAEIVADWTAHPTIPNVWRAKSPLDYPGVENTAVVIDGDRFYKVQPSIYDLDEDLEYYPEDSIGTIADSIYVYSLTDPSTRTAELSSKMNGIQDGWSSDLASINITIKNLEFRYYGFYGIDAREHTGEETDGNWIVDNCTFYYDRYGAVHFYNGHNKNTVQNCIATYCGNGFYANQTDNITIKNNTIEYSISFSLEFASSSFTDGHAIGMFMAQGTLVEGNTIIGTDTGTGIVGVDKASGTIRYNKIHANNCASIAIHRTIADDSLMIYYNELVTTDIGTPIKTDTIYTGSVVNVYNNTIVTSGTSGAITSKWSENLVMKNNIFYCSAGTYVYTQIESDNDVTSDYNLWRKNTYYSWWTVPPSAHATTWVIPPDPPSVSWQSTGNDANGVDGDPLFTTDFTDLSLQEESPAINAGVDLGFTRDILGNPIVGVPDMGAYEKQD